VQNLSAGDVEVVSFRAEHPARLLELQLHFGAVGAPADVFVWADNGGNAPDLERVLFSTTVLPEEGQWTTLDLSVENIEIGPLSLFHVGHVLRDGSTRLSWDATGAAAATSLVRIGGEWYFVGDSQGAALDALVRARVLHHDAVETFWFTDVTQEAGLAFGGRMAWGDFNNDGFEDVAMDGRIVYRNNGDGTFSRLEAPLGLPADNGGNGGIWADFDNDGCLDFYTTVHNYLPVCSTPSDCITGFSCVENRCMPDGAAELSHDRLYRGHCDGTFTDVSEEAGRPYDYLPTEGAAWGDIDNDGFVDLYVANYETPTDWTGGALSLGTIDYLWRNNGDGTFTDISESSGIRYMGRGLCGRGVAMADFNQDGWLDIYVTNYRLQGNYFFLNLGDGQFENISVENGTVGNLVSGSYGHSIGAAWGDVDNDGDFDLFVANLAHPRFIEFSDKSMLYINDGPPDWGFTEQREDWGITYSETHSDPAFGDFDNDGLLDLFITDVYAGYQGFLYRNLGSRFQDVTYPSGIRIDNGWGVTWADYDNDGDLDLLANRLYRNDYPNPGNWLKFRLHGTKANAAAIGAVVRVKAEDREWVRQVEGGKGTTTQNPLTVHVGLGNSRAESFTVRWPDRDSTETSGGVSRVGQTIDVVQESDAGIEDASPDGDAGAVREIASDGCSCRHGAQTPPDFGLRMPLLLLAALPLLLRRRVSGCRCRRN